MEKLASLVTPAVCFPLRRRLNEPDSRTVSHKRREESYILFHLLHVQPARRWQHVYTDNLHTDIFHRLFSGIHDFAGYLVSDVLCIML